jgi:hypothetical protein
MRSTHIVAVLALTVIPARVAAYSVKTTSAGATLHWRSAAVELSVHRSMIERFGEDGARVALASAIAAWGGADGGPMLLVGPTVDTPPGFERGRSTNGIYAVSPWPYEKKLLAVTISSYDTRTGELLDTDVLVNADEALMVGLRDDHYDLASVLTHELGHVLGLGEAEHEPTSTMYPRIAKFDGRARTPSPDDFEGIRAIYGASHASAGGPRIASFISPRPRGLWALSSFVAGILVILLGARRTHGTARAIVLPVRWSARDRWDEEPLHS